MVTIKVFDTEGCKELHCFDTLDYVPYVDPDAEFDEETDDNPFA